MPRPIPVFEFVFSAYATTCSRGALRPTPEAAPLLRIGAQAIDVAPAESPSAFLSGLVVKVRVLDAGASGGPLALEPGSLQAGQIEDLWLGEIVETRLGFAGVVRYRPEHLSNVRAGDIVSFGPAHVMDWKHFDPAANDATAERAPNRALEAEELALT